MQSQGGAQVSESKALPERAHSQCSDADAVQDCPMQLPSRRCCSRWQHLPTEQQHTCTGLAPAATIFMPSAMMAADRMVAVVVPSPAVSLVFAAACAPTCPGAKALYMLLLLRRAKAASAHNCTVLCNVDGWLHVRRGPGPGAASPAAPARIPVSSMQRCSFKKSSHNVSAMALL